MKIKSITREGEYIRVDVDASHREFVYRADKFTTLVDLSREIQKSMVLEQTKKAKKEDKFKKLKDDYDKENK